MTTLREILLELNEKEMVNNANAIKVIENAIISKVPNIYTVDVDESRISINTTLVEITLDYTFVLIDEEELEFQIQILNAYESEEAVLQKLTYPL